MHPNHRPLRHLTARSLLGLLERFGGINQVARHLGVDHQTVRSEMRRKGVPTRPLARVAAMSEDAILAALAECHGSYGALCRRFHVGWEPLRRVLEPRDLWNPTPFHETRLAKVATETLMDALRRRHGVSAAGRVFGVSPPVMQREMDRRGIVLKIVVECVAKKTGTG